MESFLGRRKRGEKRDAKKEGRKEGNARANPFGRLVVADAEETPEGSRRAHRQKFSSFAPAGLYTDLYLLEPGPQT